MSVVDTVAQAQGPVLVHCAAGKDRTGLSVALVLRLLGVEREHVVADYVLTEHARDAIDARLRRDDDYAVPAAFFDVRADALELALDAWDEHPDGVDGWYLASGGTPDGLAVLREGMVDQASARDVSAPPLSR